MANGIEDALRERAAESPRNAAQTPIVVVVATVAEDIDHADGQRVAGKLRREVMAATGLVQNVKADHTVNSFGAHTVSALMYEDVQDIRSQMRNALREEGYTVEGVAVQADIETSSL
jgi:uncharacterized protein (DUF2267 family)